MSNLKNEDYWTSVRIYLLSWIWHSKIMFHSKFDLSPKKKSNFKENKLGPYSMDLRWVQSRSARILCQTLPVSKQRRRLSREWKLSEATWGRPHLSAPSSTSSSYLIQRAVSFHSFSSPSTCNSSSCTNTSCGLWSNIFLNVWNGSTFCRGSIPSFLPIWITDDDEPLDWIL